MPAAHELRAGLWNDALIRMAAPFEASRATCNARLRTAIGVPEPKLFKSGYQRKCAAVDALLLSWQVTVVQILLRGGDHLSAETAVPFIQVAVSTLAPGNSSLILDQACKFYGSNKGTASIHSEIGFIATQIYESAPFGSMITTNRSTTWLGRLEHSARLASCVADLTNETAAVVRHVLGQVLGEATQARRPPETAAERPIESPTSLGSQLADLTVAVSASPELKLPQSLGVGEAHARRELAVLLITVVDMLMQRLMRDHGNETYQAFVNRVCSLVCESNPVMAKQFAEMTTKVMQEYGVVGRKPGIEGWGSVWATRCKARDAEAAKWADAIAEVHAGVIKSAIERTKLR